MEMETNERESCTQDTKTQTRLPLKLATRVFSEIKAFEYFLETDHFGGQIDFSCRVRRPITHRQDIDCKVHVYQLGLI